MIFRVNFITNFTISAYNLFSKTDSKYFKFNYIFSYFPNLYKNSKDNVLSNNCSQLLAIYFKLLEVFSFYESNYCNFVSNKYILNNIKYKRIHQNKYSLLKKSLLLSSTII